ncbi:hypothetical protein EGH21_08260 [Halomicroarcula sp. F13]|uniref:Calx-beta domain-containing protein n=1 Tax=Haloarcula rubra TaxID=2487747 RepID=A0AAW4PN53_9EURY|nr:hypothetical protein [Halomicroarcula rubra]MBX0323018.1 hypothetical protein [Halomicroarcula rubra]
MSTAVLVGATVLPAASFTTAEVGRGATISVVDDSNAIHNLAVASSATIGQTSRLVTVTNDLGTDVSVEIALRADSTDKGDLVVDGTSVGDSYTFSLATGTSREIDIDVVSDSTLDGEQIYFGVNATGTGLTVTAPDRNVSLTT